MIDFFVFCSIININCKSNRKSRCVIIKLAKSNKKYKLPLDMMKPSEFADEEYVLKHSVYSRFPNIKVVHIDRFKMWDSLNEKDINRQKNKA